MVHPVPAPVSTSAELNNNNKLNGNNQNEMLFRRGNAMSGAPIRIGTIMFPLEMEPTSRSDPLKEPNVQVAPHSAQHHNQRKLLELCNNQLVTFFVGRTAFRRGGGGVVMLSVTPRMHQGQVVNV